jgi:hypothetical protein
MIPPTSRQSYTAGHFELAIDGHKSTAFLKSVDGGWSKASVVDEPVGSSNNRVKHVSTVEIDPISIELGMANANDVLQWIQGSWNRQWDRRSGVITHANFDLNETYEHEFYDALVAETTIPLLDGASKDSGYIKCKIQPERVLTKKLPGVKRAIAPIGLKTKQKLWTTSAFRFNLDTIDEMAYTNKIESFTITQSIKKMFTGQDRFPQIEPTGIKFPNLTGTISLAYADKLLKWHDDYVNKGKKDHGAQKSGSIEFLTPDRKQTLFQINLFEVGISAVSIQQATANQDQIKRVKFELFVHRMELDGAGSLGFE